MALTEREQLELLRIQRRKHLQEIYPEPSDYLVDEIAQAEARVGWYRSKLEFLFDLSSDQIKATNLFNTQVEPLAGMSQRLQTFAQLLYANGLISQQFPPSWFVLPAHPTAIQRQREEDALRNALDSLINATPAPKRQQARDIFNLEQSYSGLSWSRLDEFVRLLDKANCLKANDGLKIVEREKRKVER